MSEEKDELEAIKKGFRKKYLINEIYIPKERIFRHLRNDPLKRQLLIYTAMFGHAIINEIQNQIRWKENNMPRQKRCLDRMSTLSIYKLIHIQNLDYFKSTDHELYKKLQERRKKTRTKCPPNRINVFSFVDIPINREFLKYAIKLEGYDLDKIIEHGRRK